MPTKTKLIVTAIVAVIITGIVLYLYLAPSCEFPDYIKENNYTINLSETEARDSNYSCLVPVTSCTGKACVAPALQINCGDSRDICNKEIKCECGNYIEQRVKDQVYGEDYLDYYTCEQNSDCTTVKYDCCGCQNGGLSTSINKKYVSEWQKENLSNCEDTMCLTVYMCSQGAPACINNRCTFEKLDT